MKRFFAMILALTLVLSLAACGGSAAPAEEEKKELPVATAAEDPTEATLYKDIMKPYDEITHGSRLILLQNAVRYTANGLMTKEEEPVPEAVTYNGAEASAYLVTDVTKYATQEITGTVKVFGTDGQQHDIAAEDFLSMQFVIDDFQSGNPAALLDNGAVVTEFDYAVFESGEGIFSVISEQEVHMTELFAKFGWDVAGTYNLVATDFFYIPITPDDYDEGGIRGTLSGSVNAAFVDMVIAMGKINDVAFVEQMVG